MKRQAALAGVVLAVAVAAGLVVRHYRRPRSPSPPPAVPIQLNREHEALHQRLDELLKDDKLVTEVLAMKGDVILGVRSSLARSLIQEVAARYLDKVGLDLKDIRVEKEGKLKSSTPIGRKNVGRWAITLTIHRVQGVLRAGVPRVEVRGANRLAVAMPVRIAEGHGNATLAFSWDPHSIVKLVCHDFDVVEPMAGRILPREYPVSGVFVFTASGRRLIATPQSWDRTFRLEVDPSEESWAKVRRALEEQNQLDRCGLAMSPDDVMDQLRELVAKGFDVKLPRRLYRPVSFPAAFRESVTVDDRPVDLAVQPYELRTTPDVIWFAATVRTRVGESTASASRFPPSVDPLPEPDGHDRPVAGEPARTPRPEPDAARSHPLAALPALPGSPDKARRREAP